MRSLKGNAVLRWRYRPGSTIYFVWTQERSDFEKAASELEFERAPNAVPENVFLLKVTFYLTR